MLRLSLVLSLLSLPLLACSSSEPEGCERFDFPLAPQVSATHVCSSTPSTACGNGLTPPTAGSHCNLTLSCQTYDTEQPSCFWLHNLEHGHAVFLYNCPEGCPDELAKLEQARNEARVGSNGVRRAVVAPASGLPNRVAAILWRRAYLADTADPEALRCLLQLQDQEAPEPGLNCAQ
jgi:hypothetical protein